MEFEVTAATLRCKKCGLERKMRIVSDEVTAEYSSKSLYSVKVNGVLDVDGEEEQYIFSVGGPKHKCRERKHFVYGTWLW